MVDLVRFDEEPYYFPDAPALLRALHQSAKAEGVVAAQPGAQGWSGRELKQVEALLQPHTYPPCGAVTSCLREWTQFAHRGEGYREGPAMPGDQVSFHTECWNFPEPIVPPIIAGSRKDEPADRKLRIPERTQAGDRKERTLRDKWQATHDMDPPAWADRGFAGIKVHMNSKLRPPEAQTETPSPSTIHHRSGRRVSKFGPVWILICPESKYQ